MEIKCEDVPNVLSHDAKLLEIIELYRSKNKDMYNLVQILLSSLERDPIYIDIMKKNKEITDADKDKSRHIRYAIKKLIKITKYYEAQQQKLKQIDTSSPTCDYSLPPSIQKRDQEMPNNFRPPRPPPLNDLLKTITEENLEKRIDYLVGELNKLTVPECAFLLLDVPNSIIAKFFDRMDPTKVYKILDYFVSKYTHPTKFFKPIHIFKHLKNKEFIFGNVEYDTLYFIITFYITKNISSVYLLNSLDDDTLLRVFEQFITENFDGTDDAKDIENISYLLKNITNTQIVSKILLNNITDTSRIAEILDNMDKDKIAEIFEHFPSEKKEEIIKLLKHPDLKGGTKSNRKRKSMTHRKHIRHIK